jgi:DNA (cytosine-5)-methyltransferase 1
MSLKVIDLFAGVGGLSLGFEQCGFEVLLANEFDVSIAESYRANHKKTKMVVGDIVKLDRDKVFSPFIGKVDVIIGGPPCQGFSQKGKRKSINDDRNFLFKYFVSVVELVKPKYFVMENVPNLLSTEKGFFKKEIYALFGSLGYTLDSGVLNAADYGVPQNRRRAVIIGKMGDKPVKLPFSNSKKTTIWDAISDLAYLNSSEGEEESDYLIPPKSEYQKQLRKNSKFLHNHIATNHSKTALERLELIPPNGGRSNLPEEHLTKSIYSGTWTRMRKNEQSVTITTRFDTPSSGKFTHPFLNRAITVREAARIQSFPDSFVFIGSKTSQMKQVGNAVPPMLANAIAKVIQNDTRREQDD